MAEFEVRVVVEAQAELGEAPLWSVDDQALFWVDIEHRKFHRYDPADGSTRTWDVPAIPGCFAFRPGGGRAVIATNRGYYDLDFATGAFELTTPAPFDPDLYRFNDGKPDRQGRLWAGAMLIAFDYQDSGTFYRYENGVPTPALPEISVPNGVAFSPDGTVMYRAESIRKVIYRYDYDIATGTPSNRQVFAETPENFGIPDGATVDTDGYYWSATPFGDAGRIVRYAPDGRQDLVIEMPVFGVTMVAFGGPDLSTLYATSGRADFMLQGQENPLAGNLFAIDTPFRGIAEAPVR